LTGLPQHFQRLVDELARLPSIGGKSALRLAYHIISANPEQGQALAAAVEQAIANISFCSRCFFFAEAEQCVVCNNPSRDQRTLCVVEKPMDVLAVERMGEYRGLYHVLHGVWAPLRGISPDKLKLKELTQRIEQDQVLEVILATSSTVEGDATASYIARMLAQHGVSVSRLAQGMPKGGELEYADDLTLSRALSGRNRLSI
jgi:recombination protein RecR